MKICFLAGANSIHSYRWIKYFADKGHEICWISLTPLTAGEVIQSIRYYELPQFPVKILSVSKSIIHVRKLIRKIKPDVLHAHYAGIYGLLGALSGFHPFIVTAWGSDILMAGKAKIKKLFVKHVLKKADLITCDAEHMRVAIRKLGNYLEKINIIYFGIDTQIFTPGGKDSELIKKLDVFNSPVIISLRNLEPIYDIETLVQSIPLVLDSMPHTKFVIIGTGSREKMIQELARSLSVSDKIRFVGKIPNADICRYLRTADIYVSTALSDAGIAASTAEAMACGLPVVITDSGENKKWVKNREGGFLIPIRSHKILAEKIIYLLKNSDFRMRCGEINRKVIEKRNNYYIEMGKMDKIYKEMTRKK
jgi:glycosyltransferase involved in cell wall biosynthesis